MRINNNISALNTWRNMGITDGNMSKSLERLSSGLRINRAADDAAGLAVSEKMRSQVKGLNQAIRNAQDGISMIQTAEGALTETHSILQRMRELSIQASNGTLQPEDRAQLQEEFSQLQDEVNRIADKTEFNGKQLLTGALGEKVTGKGTNIDGAADPIVAISTNNAAIGAYTLTTDTATDEMTVTFTDNGVTHSQTLDMTTGLAGTATATIEFADLGISVEYTSAAYADAGSADITANNAFTVATGNAALQIGANANQTMDIAISNMGTGTSGLNIATLKIDNDTNAQSATTTLSKAIDTVSTQRAKLGAMQNRLEHTVANLNVAAENLTAAESRIRDVDMASEMASFTRSQILLQAGTAMMAQANQKPQTILQLLR